MAFLPALVGPFAGLELAFHIDLGSFAQVPLDDVDHVVVEHGDAVPFGAPPQPPLLQADLIGLGQRDGEWCQRDSGERSKGSRCWKLASPQKCWKYGFSNRRAHSASWDRSCMCFKIELATNLHPLIGS